MSQLLHLKQDMLKVAKLLFDRRLVSGSTGNLSLRLGGGRFLITPSRKNKFFLKEQDLLVVNSQGEVVEGQGQPTSEIFLHLSIYERKPEVKAIVHAHPPYTVALTLHNFPLDYPYLPEALFLKIGISSYSTPGTTEVPENILPLLSECRVIVLERHGVVALGESLFEAFDLVDSLEHLAEVYWAARNLGPFSPLTPSQIKKWLAVWNPKETDERD